MLIDILKSLLVLPYHRYKRKNDKPFLPEILTLTITWKCNYRCQMCDAWKIDSGEELVYEDFLLLLKDKSFSGIKVVRVTGGEPFMRKDLGRILILFARMPNIRVMYINTNGSFKNETMEVVKSILSENRRIRLIVNTSMDGMPKEHDRIRGIQGALGRTIRTIKALKELKKTEPRLELGINQTVLTPGLEKIDYVTGLARNLKIPYHGEIALKLNGGNLFSNFIGESVPNKIVFEPYSKFSALELRNALDAIQKGMGLRKAGIKSFRWLKDITSLYFFRGLKQRLLGNEITLNPPCQALFSHVRIMPDGAVITCFHINNELANVKNKSFSEILHCDEVKMARKTVKNCPGCWIGCEVIPNSVYSGSIVAYAIREVLTALLLKPLN